MAGGAIYPSSVDYGSSGDLFPNLYQGAGGNTSPNEWGHGVVASLGSDRTLSLRFPMPPSIPTGTLKLRVLALANATSGAAKVHASDGLAVPAVSPASSGNPSAITLTADTLATITWAASENDRYKEAKVTLSSVPSGNEQLVVAVKFETSGWTLAVTGTFIFSVIWE